MIETTTIAPLLLAAVLLLPAVFIDVAVHRIPNKLCLAGIVAGLALHTAFAGASGFGLALAAGALLLLATFPFFALGWLGAGDVKLMAAVGCVAGAPAAALAILLVTLVTGALMALLVLARHHALKHFVRRMKMLEFLTQPGMSLGDMSALTQLLPYSIPIAIGSIGVLAARAL